ncbi:hypothetical protein HELRODRAFT_165366 [Helobdella robusta]|uniref:Uncharacterized protein n=1 Tax=Helobdella robusta TaxID=6412 RepID=T1EWN2_HELRO|nr:hypothetical protein HELRODRAFT_165366 [Helobdella robusta]ESN91342.1 hypothetical protein HELRODRAFT_165366 [Helobdella robusta]
MTQRLREDLRACGKVGPYARQEGRNIFFARPVYSDLEVCKRYCRPAGPDQRNDRQREEGESVWYRAAGGVYDCLGADGRRYLTVSTITVATRTAATTSVSTEEAVGRNAVATFTASSTTKILYFHYLMRKLRIAKIKNRELKNL